MGQGVHCINYHVSTVTISLFHFVVGPWIVGRLFFVFMRVEFDIYIYIFSCETAEIRPEVHDLFSALTLGGKLK